MEVRNRMMTPALTCLSRAKDHMKKAAGFGEPAVEIPVADLTLIAAEGGGHRCVISMDALIDIVERLERHYPEAKWGAHHETGYPSKLVRRGGQVR